MASDRIESGEETEEFNAIAAGIEIEGDDCFEGDVWETFLEPAEVGIQGNALRLGDLGETSLEPVRVEMQGHAGRLGDVEETSVEPAGVGMQGFAGRPGYRGEMDLQIGVDLPHGGRGWLTI